MKIVLVNLPWKKAHRWGVRAGSRWPHIKDHTEDNYLAFPFYLAYAAALLKKNGFDVYIIDAIAEQLSHKAFNEKINGLRPDLLVAETSTVTLWYDVNFLRQLKGQMSIALCGPDIHISRNEFLQDAGHVDFTLFGEYEATLLELAQTIQAKKDLKNVSGIIYRAGGKVIKNSPRPLIADLDWLPWPLREQLPIKRYNDSPGDIPIPCASMWASRGCPFRCSFCLWPQVMYNGNTYRTRAVKNVVDEMEYLIKKLGFKSIYFDDDTWNIGKERIFAFCDELQKRELKIPWAIMARAELMDEELLERMHEVGLFAVKYGVESSSQQILNNTGKGLDLKKTEEVIKYTKYLGIKTHLTFTFGLPGETQRTIKETIDYALKLNPTSVQFSIATPFPGTRFYEEMERKGYILTKSLEKLDGNHSSVIRTESLSGRQLQKAKNRAYQVWQGHCRLRRKHTLSKREALKLKAVRSLKTYGIGATFLKVIRYVLRRLFFLPVRIKHFFGRRLWIVEETVSYGHLTLRFGEGKIRVYWKDKEISKDVGLTTSFHYGDNWFDSSQANWKLEKQGADKITVRLKWDDVPVRQEWQLSLAEGTIFWSSALLVERGVQLLEYKAGIMIQDAYNMWQDDLGTGKFPKITDWEEIELYNANSSILAVMKKDTRDKESLPDLELSDKGRIESNTYPQIQNTDARIKARLLQIRRLKIAQFLPGNYPYFDLEIKIKERKAVAQTLAGYKKPVAFKFITEQMATMGVLRVLLKIMKHLHPRNLNSYYGDIMGVLDTSYAYKGPSFVQIDITNDCNNDCIGCWCNSPLLGDKKISDAVKRQSLPYEIVKNTIDDLCRMGTKEIYFAGGGEPFMHPDLLRILAHVKMRGLRCYINTNFTLVTEDVAKRLVELKADNMVVSVWAATPQTYLATHPNKSGAMFYQVKGMLSLLNMLKKDAPRVNIYNVISSLNYQELEQMVELAVETGCDSVEFTVIDTIPGGTDRLLLTDRQREVVLNSCERIMRRLEGDLKGRINILQFDQFIRRVENKDAKDANYDKDILTQMPCYIGWLFTRILADGNVNFCLKAHRIPVGNIYAHDFSQIWNSQRQQEFRRRALCAGKDDEFFSFIGNDPGAKVGCFKSCDDLARNVRMHKKMQSLTLFEVKVLRLYLLWKKTQRYFRKNALWGQIRRRIKKNIARESTRIKSGRLEAVLHDEGIKLLWEGREITQSVGLNASVCVFGLWYDSSKAQWTIERHSDTELVLRNVWKRIPIAQEWRIVIENDRIIRWYIHLIIDSKIEIEQKKVSIMLPTSYKHWKSGSSCGGFPRSLSWQEMSLDKDNCRNIIVRKARCKGADLPQISFDFSEIGGFFTPQIQNSDTLVNARIVSALHQALDNEQVVLPGEYDMFSAKIIIGDGNV